MIYTMIYITSNSISVIYKKIFHHSEKQWKQEFFKIKMKDVGMSNPKNMQTSLG